MTKIYPKGILKYTLQQRILYNFLLYEICRQNTCMLFLCILAFFSEESYKYITMNNKFQNEINKKLRKTYIFIQKLY